MKPIYKIEQWDDMENGFVLYDTKHDEKIALIVAKAHADRRFHVRVIHEGVIIWEKGR